MSLPILRELFGTSRRLKRLLKDGLTFRWITSLPEKLPGRRQQRRLARRRPKQERLKAETAERLRRMQGALDQQRIRRARKGRARRRVA